MISNPAMKKKILPVFCRERKKLKRIKIDKRNKKKNIDGLILKDIYYI